MIYHPVAKLAEAGIREVLIITGTEHMGAVVGTLGSGHAIGMEFTYRVQDQAGGIAQALGLAKGFLNGERCVVILGDNIFEDSIVEYVARYRAQARGAKVLLKEVPDPQRYGVPLLDGDHIVRIDEKPSQPASSYAVTGIYMYDELVMDYISTLAPSPRGELEISDVNNEFIRTGSLTFDILSGWWTDAGTPGSLALANRLAEHLRLPLFSQPSTQALA